MLHNRTNDIMYLLSKQYPAEAQNWALEVATATYRAEINDLIQPHAGFHFRVTHSDLGQLEDFSMVNMGKKIKGLTPDLWWVLGVLLDAKGSRRQATPDAGGHIINEDIEMDLGEIGGEGGKGNAEENWADLAADGESSDSEDDEDAKDAEAQPQGVFWGINDGITPHLLGNIDVESRILQNKMQFYLPL
jgi:hypothetical protein